MVTILTSWGQKRKSRVLQFTHAIFILLKKALAVQGELNLSLRRERILHRQQHYQMRTGLRAMIASSEKRRGWKQKMLHEMIEYWLSVLCMGIFSALLPIIED